jgi:hypothetical protein
VRTLSLFVIASILPVLVSGVAGRALALCDLKVYDQTSPPHIRGVVDDQYAEFEWASDADLDKQSGWFIWNYILNENNKDPLIANWPKGQIQISTIRPSPPHGITCRKIPVDCATDHPMPDAPIWYSASNQRQDAKAYLSVPVAVGSPPPLPCATAQAAASPTFARPLSSNLASTYINDQHQVVDLEFVAVAAAQDNKITLTLKYRPLDLIVGLAGLPQRIDPKQLSEIMGQLGQRGISTHQTNMSRFTDINFSKQKLLSFNSDWRGLDEQEFLFMWGKEGDVNLIYGDSNPPQPAEAAVILLDALRKPILMTRIPVYLPAR